MNRSTFLRASAGTFLGSGLLLGTAPPAGADPLRPRDVRTTKVADLTGPGLTTRFRMEATDLGIPTRTPDGRMLFVFGDSFEQARVGGGWWRSPTALHSTTTDLGSGVQWSGAVGGEAAQQLWDYEHDNPVFTTVLPSDVITLGDSMYLHAMVNNGLGNVVWTEIWRSDDSGATWVHTGAEFAPDLHQGLFQLLTWAAGDDGYVYVCSTSFDRSRPIILHRVPAEAIADPTAYEPWGHRDGVWAWGNHSDPEGAFVRCAHDHRRQWVLTWFNAGIDGIIMDTPTSDLYAAHRRTLVHGRWGERTIPRGTPTAVVPGSTLSDLLTVSRWNGPRVMQYRVQTSTLNVWCLQDGRFLIGHCVGRARSHF